MADIKSKIKKLAEKYSKEIIDLRRKIHRNPELSFEEYETSKLVYEKLSKLKIDRVQRVSQTGVVGLIKNKNGKCVGLRADMDALPIHEKTGLPFASKNHGVMHACGHDAHTSMLYGAALILNEIKAELNGSVKLIFQPAEEKNPGGASILIKQGVLENPKVNAIFGQHVMVDKPAGSLGFCEGVTFASQDELYITIYGRQSHGAKPHKSIDPIVTASGVVMALQTIVSRNTSPYDPIVITIGAIHGGTATNIIPSEVKLMGTIRTLNENLRKKSLKLIERTIKGITQAAGAKYKFEISPGYPELNNDSKLTDFARKAAVDFSGSKNVFKSERIMGAEDFAFYLKKKPGTFYRIGAGRTSDIHTQTINIDEKTLPVGAGFMAYLAVKYLNSNQ
ncbi:MAG: M20 family metallopeptidase [Chlorobi bacterium]|nr:M20 family metallopeptidase [Chlorobiota bacterium]MCI0715796.1 M20 family metallopeptidase [Chlorobiota bacterium]